MGIMDFRQVPDAALPSRLSTTSLNATIGTEVSTVGHAARDALNQVFVRFVDLAGNPITARHVTIKVDTTTWEISDIVAEA